MELFKTIKKRLLTNAQHFAFIQAFLTALQAAGFSTNKLLAKLAELSAAFATEDQYYMIVRASEIVAQREAADNKRDRYYTCLHRLVQVWAGSGMANLDPAASALMPTFNLYKVKINAQTDEETGVLENLITDLSTPEMQAHIATINGTFLFQQMKDGQDQVKALRLEQGVEESHKVYGALAAARKTCDKLYDQMTDLIESFSKTADDETPYLTFISEWNGTVKLYQDMLDRKSGTSSSGSGNGSNGSSGNTEPTNPNEPSNPNEPINPGGGDTPSTGSDTPGGGSGGGDNGENSGGGDNGGGDNGGGGSTGNGQGEDE